MAGPPQGWKAVAVTVPSRREDEVVALLAGRVLGFRVDPAGSGCSRVEVYVEQDADLNALQSCIAGILEQIGTDPGCGAMTTRSIPDGRWVEVYQASLRPFHAGQRFVIHPAAFPHEAGDTRIPIHLVPGRAFGTGEHATTRMCLSALEQAVTRGSRWLDVGCGSGILSVAAARLGAAAVTAVDNDPDAVEVCREVAEANQVSDTVQALEGSLEQVGATGFDGLVANIHAPFFLEHAAGLSRLLRPGGLLVGTGFLDADLPEITVALEGAGLVVRASRRQDEWALILAGAPS